MINMYAAAVSRVASKSTGFFKFFSNISDSENFDIFGFASLVIVRD